MKILAFETSCDDTAVAVVEDGVNVISNVRVSQVEHEKWGGVVPEIAARLHAENWRGAMEKCLEESELKVSDIDYVAVTNGPGLQTSLQTGTVAASFLAQFFQKKIIPVQHIRGHINSIFLGRRIEDVEFPALVLTVSGGHTDMFLQSSATEVEKLGGTIDDAAGEAFDKCAKMLGLGYPGGPLVSRAAEKGDSKRFKFPRPYLAKSSFDFSFSGIKAAVYREIEDEKQRLDPSLSSAQGEQRPLPEGGFDEQYVADVCAGFEQAVVDVFVKKVKRALDRFPELKAVHFTGGVSANRAIREALKEVCAKRGVEFRVPVEFAYCTDNAAMIGAEAFIQLQKNPEIAQKQFVNCDSRLQV